MMFRTGFSSGSSSSSSSSDEDGVSIVGDEDQIYVVFKNLVINERETTTTYYGDGTGSCLREATYKHMIQYQLDIEDLTQKNMCLGIHYLDIFLLKSHGEQLCQSGLLAVVCLNLAAKFDSARDAPLLDRYRTDDIEFTDAEYERVELAVLRVIGWETAIQTPLSYLSCIIKKLEACSIDIPNDLKTEVSTFIISSYRDISSQDYKCFIFAAAAVYYCLDVPKDKYKSFFMEEFCDGDEAESDWEKVWELYEKLA